MKMYWSTTWLALAISLTIVRALPTTLVEDVKANDIKDNKVKRAQEDFHRSDESPSASAAYFSNPSAIKRGADQSINDWEQDQAREGMPNIPSTLYSTDEGQFDDKSISDYEKGYHYGTNKDKLDEALENAVLKSEIYGEPGALNQYRYFGGNTDERRRRRRDAKKIRIGERYKRDLELSPEDILTLLTLWENDRRRNQEEYRPIWSRYEPNLDLENERSDNDIDQDDESWLDTPVYPHATLNQFAAEYPGNSPYIYDDKRSMWGKVSDSRKKRFMVARKKNDPTRELHYLNGPTPNRNDFYTLSQLLAAQREPNVPLYHRLVL